MSSGGRGQLLVPWPNRVRDGRWTHDGRDLQLALTEPSRHNASHGLARWAAWSLRRADAGRRCALGLRLMAQTGYPWVLDLQVTYALDDDGLHRHPVGARTAAPTPAPHASGAHPYLSAGPGPVDSWLLTCPGATRRAQRRRAAAARGPRGRRRHAVRLPHRAPDRRRRASTTPSPTWPATPTAGPPHAWSTPRTGRGVELWVDAAHPWLMLYTADDVPATARRSLAVEPMTAPADALQLRRGPTWCSPPPARTVTGSPRPGACAPCTARDACSRPAGSGAQLRHRRGHLAGLHRRRRRPRRRVARCCSWAPTAAASRRCCAAWWASTPPTAGEVTPGRRGHSTSARPAVRRAVAAVLDDIDFFPDLTVVEHLDLVARAHGVPGRRGGGRRGAARARPDRPERPAARGRCPRASAAGWRWPARSCGPRRLLVLDEPEQRLDAAGVTWLAERLLRERADGLAVLVATHSPVLVEALSRGGRRARVLELGAES